jgi:hypothetical protein
MSTSITVEFQVNDLDANYEVVGTSDNYSFQEKLGLGSDIVFAEGDAFVKVIPLKGNYGIFDLRVFAVTDIGVRSPSVIGRIEVLPKELEDTFTFSEINTNQNLDSSVVYVPTYAGDKLEIDCEFGGKSIEFNWSLVPPNGHPQEGNSLSTELLNDTFLSGFKINLFNDGQIIDLEQAGYSETSLAALSSTLQTDKENVQGIFNNYRDFSLSLNEAVFNDLNLSRDVSLQIVSVDRFGREATGIANATNLEPVISNLNYSTKGSDTSFSWESTDTDFKDVKVEVLAVPEGVSLAQEDDLQVSASYLKSLKQAKPYNDFVGAYYAAGDKVIYNEKIYEAIQAHTRGNNEYPDDDFEIDEQTGEVIEGVANWALIGDAINFLYFSSNDPDDDLELKNINEDDTLKNVEISDDLKTFSATQLWGYKYYYTFQPYDEFGEGKVYNLTKKGLIDKNADDSILEAILVNVKIDNLRFREVKDDLVFNWDVTDQDGNLVDLNQYKFLFGGQDFPSVLGISGSLYDIHTDQKITGITNGFNSKSLDFDEDGDLVVNANLPSTKVFDQYKYTRELNNSIYKTGGFPSNFGDYDLSQNYVSGDNVLSDGKIYTANTQNNEQIPNVEPGYSTWSASKTYLSAPSDTFSYRKNIYKTINDFGPNSSSVSGLFNEGSVYSVGDIVLSPETDVSVFSETDSYVPGDFVFYSGSIYECLQTIATEENAFPDNPDFWSRADIFNDIACAYFESTANSNSSYPFDVSSDWNKVTPASLAANGQFFQFIIPAYELPISDWSLQDSYNAGSFVVYENDIWSGTQFSENKIPSGGSNYWSNQSNSQDIGLYSTYHSRNYQSGDLVYSNNFVYKCTKDDPVGGPITAITNEGELILSNYEQTNWLPYWELNDQYDDVVFKHIGIPQSGKRNVGIELGIVDKNGKIINQANLAADNPPPYILTEGFNVDSTSEATKVKFNFNYALGFQEKTTKVHLYRSSEPDFEITGSDGLPYDKVSGVNNPDSTLVSITLGSEGAAFGDNINQIIDEPKPDQWNEEGVNQITGYYYKVLPFDDFGSGVLYNVPDGSMRRVIVYPKRYNNPNPNVMPGRVLKSNPTSTTDAVPGAIQNLTGSTSFENFFLNWNAPGSNFFDNNTSTDFENDIDHYEVWQSDDPYIKSGENKNATTPWLEAENTGYRKIKGVAYSVSEGNDIPEESLDPARYIFDAENIFNVAANTPSVEVVHGGKTNDTKYFWIRAVDFAGNKSPFSDMSNDVNLKGLELSLGPAPATDISGFETALTEKFTNTIALNPNNPFSHGGKWVDHDLFYSGVKYDIIENTIDITSGYVWWQTGNTFYNTGAVHPATLKGNDESYPYFNDGDFIVARINDRKVTPAFSVFANALIGTANIENASIINAKINDLSADKITAGQIKGHRIEVFHSGVDQSNNYGSIASKGFSGIEDYSTSGFVLSGDGSFAFQQGAGALTFEDDKLILYGGFRSSRELDFDFVDIDLSPRFFTYHEKQDGTFEPADDCPDTINIRTTFRNSRIESSGVRFKMEAVSGNQRYDVFGYDDHDANGDYNNISGFTYIGDFYEGIEQKTAHATFDLTGFSGILESYSQVADSVVITAKSNKSELERSTTVTRVIDGRAGDDGQTGASVNIAFVRVPRDETIEANQDGSSSVPASFTQNGITYTWTDSPPADNGDQLFAVKGTTSIGGTSYTWGTPYRVDGESVAEVYIYTSPTSSSAPTIPGNITYNFTDNSLANLGNDWLNSVSNTPLSNNQKIYAAVGLAVGTPGDLSAEVTFGGQFIFSQRIDGDKGNNGLTPTYRGEWNKDTLYVSIPSTSTDPGRGDIVYYSGYMSGTTQYYGDADTKYYMCIEDIPNISSQDFPPYISTTQGQGNLNSTYWLEFGDEFENVATNLLLTKEAKITEKLTMGAGGSDTEVPHSGIIVSDGFVGGLLNVNTEPYEIIDNTTNFENYDTPGFLLARTDDSVVFDVGGTGIVGQTGYIRFDSKSGKLEIAGSFINNTVIDEGLFYDGSFNQFQDGDNLTSFIGGGYNNKLSGSAGNDKYFENLGSAILGGAWNTMNSRFSSIAGGYSGYLADNFSFIGGGFGNKMPLEEPGDHQGANFIGCGIDNQVNGGASQTILNGIHNTIEGLTGSFVPVMDSDNGLFSKRALGRFEGGISYDNVDFHDSQFGWTATTGQNNWSGVWFPAGLGNNTEPVESTNIQDYFLNNWDKSLFVGGLNGVSQAGWVYYRQFGWVYTSVNKSDIIYSDDVLDEVFCYIPESKLVQSQLKVLFYKFFRNGASQKNVGNGNIIHAKYLDPSSNYDEKDFYIRYNLGDNFTQWDYNYHFTNALNFTQWSDDNGVRTFT